MTRKLSFLVLIGQFALLIVLICLTHLVSNGGVTESFGKRIFMFIGVTIVVLSPFGVFSIILSTGYRFMKRHGLLSAKQMQHLNSNAPIMFFVWKEVREMILKADNTNE